MKLHFKPILWMVGGILVMFGASLALELRRNSANLGRLSSENLATLEQHERDNAENVFVTVENAVKSSLERGEMEKFIQTVKVQKSVRGLIEFSLFDRNGLVTHSSDSTNLNRRLPAELRGRLLTGREKVTRRTAEAFEIYNPQSVQADCLRCHLDWKEGEAGGILFCRFSTKSLTEGQRLWSNSIVSMQRTQILDGILTTLAIAAIFGTLAVLAIRYQVAAPLVRVLEKLTGASDQLGATSSELSMASQSLADRANRQAASLEETSASIEELSTMIKRNAVNARDANHLADQTRQAAESGEAEMAQMNDAMAGIEESNSNIARIIKTIDEIAFQTNILALNAAVEAARAGAAGQGFAVVADEVRRLAQRSAEAAKETAALIENSILRSRKGVETSQHVGQHFGEIVEKVHRVAEFIREIATASTQQDEGVTQLNGAVRDIDTLTQSNAASAQETSSAAVQLHGQAEGLQQAIDELMQLMAGGGPESRPNTGMSRGRGNLGFGS